MNPADEIDRYRDYISAALEHASGTYTFEDVKQGVVEGRFQLWPAPNSVVITEIQEYPQARWLHLFIGAGNLPELQIMLPIIEAWGRSQGCTRISLTGRKGWERTFLTRDAGFTPTLVTYEKPL
jgi:hypothetical protein